MTYCTNLNEKREYATLSLQCISQSHTTIKLIIPFVKLQSYNARIFVSGWRLFDDSIVTPVTEREVMTRDAYVLFYKRRQTAPKIPTTIDVSAQESQDCENSFEKMDASKPEDFEMTSADNYEVEKCKEVVCRKYEENDTHDDEVKHKLKLQKDYVDKTNISNSLICEQYTDMDSID